ncbi:MAG: 4,5-DOPA dioxygenase extradiol [Bacteroidia bacterium]
MNLQEFHKNAIQGEAMVKQPVVFIGHGDPMNALRNNAFTQSLNVLGTSLKSIEAPKAILCVSAHWLTKGTWVNNAAVQPTIHDFGGFPQELFDVQYPAAGAPDVAAQAAALLSESQLTTDWGLDHGAWTVLRHVFPEANIPVFQMSIDYYRGMDYHMELAAKLKELRNKGVLIVGSGNVVHNLQKSFEKMSAGDATPYDWAIEFDTWVKDKIQNCDWADLAKYNNTAAGMLSVPTPDHYAPLMYIMGLADEEESIDTFYESVEYGGLSMRSFKIG